MMDPTEFDFDILIIGGGIHGVGVAQAAAAEGYSVCLLEQQSLASGTSSRSSKLIHGGLRYLETARFHLVHECLRERSLLLKLAPELVRIQPFYIPIYPDTRRRPWQLQLGLSLYYFLGGLNRDCHFHRLPRRQWSTLDGLDTRGLQQVFQYWDAQTDDAALTRAVMKSAITMGARLLMPARFSHAQLLDAGCAIHYQVAGALRCCTARVVVNAAGPWINQVLEKITPRVTPLPIDLVQGTHIIVAGRLQQGFYYLEAPSDQRAVFAMPWQDHIMIGTTETIFQGDPAQVTPTHAEIRYLLETFTHYFPAFRAVQEEQLISSFAGLRVLSAGRRQASHRSRETILHPDRAQGTRLLSIYGGKLTAYRATAATVIARLKNSLPPRQKIADTTHIPLTPA